jgi:hypothetical protein
MSVTWEIAMRKRQEGTVTEESRAEEAGGRGIRRKAMTRIIIELTAILLLMASPAWAGAPVASAGADQSVYVGERVLLDGSAADPDGDPIVRWLWSFTSKPQGSVAALSNPLIAAPYFTADVAGDYVLSLTVSDGAYRAGDVVVIHAQPAVGISSRSATIKLQNSKKGFGKILLEVDLDMPMPAPGDTLALSVDGIALFEAAFSDFHAGDDEPGVYVFKDRRVLVVFLRDEMVLRVFCHKVLLDKLDPENGVTVEIDWGDAAAAETLTMEPAPGDRLLYSRT